MPGANLITLTGCLGCGSKTLVPGSMLDSAHPHFDTENFSASHGVQEFVPVPVQLLGHDVTRTTSKQALAASWSFRSTEIRFGMNFRGNPGFRRKSRFPKKSRFRKQDFEDSLSFDLLPRRPDGRNRKKQTQEALPKMHHSKRQRNPVFFFS